MLCFSSPVNVGHFVLFPEMIATTLIQSEVRTLGEERPEIETVLRGRKMARIRMDHPGDSRKRVDGAHEKRSRMIVGRNLQGVSFLVGGSIIIIVLIIH